MGGLSESVKKENSWQKSFLKIIFNEVLKIIDIGWCKSSEKQQEIKHLVALSYKYL